MNDETRAAEAQFLDWGNHHPRQMVHLLARQLRVVRDERDRARSALQIDSDAIEAAAEVLHQADCGCDMGPDPGHLSLAEDVLFAAQHPDAALAVGGETPATEETT